MSKADGSFLEFESSEEQSNVGPYLMLFSKESTTSSKPGIRAKTETQMQWKIRRDGLLFQQKHRSEPARWFNLRGRQMNLQDQGP